jgi:Tol biopolymer transport system component
MSRDRFSRALRVALLAVAATLLPAAPTHASFPGQNGKIAFASNRDGNWEIYSMNPDGSDQTNLTNNPATDWEPTWSRDDTKIAFVSSRGGGNSRLFVMDADGSNVRQILFDSAQLHPSWSPDGTQLALTDTPGTSSGLVRVNADGTGMTGLAIHGYFTGDFDAAWSPDGEPIAFTRGSEYQDQRGIWTVNPDATWLRHITSFGQEPDWSPDHQKIVFAYGGLQTMAADGGAVTPVPLGGSQLSDPVWSPDGTRFAAVGGSGGHQDVYAVSTDGTGLVQLTTDPAMDWQPSWQTLNATSPPQGYPRPKGAAQVETSLVLAYKPCNSPNRVHGPPLAAPSCNPPSQDFQMVTVGTLDSNGLPAKFAGLVRLTAMVGNAATPANEADVKFETSLKDIRCKITIPEDPDTAGWPCHTGALTDYTGEMQAMFTIQITDRRNGYLQNRPGTAQEIAFPITIPCDATADGTIGSLCSTTTTFNSVAPGAAVEKTRAIWALRQVQVFDGGPDGRADTNTAPGTNSLFAVEGIFAP